MCLEGILLKSFQNLYNYILMSMFNYGLRIFYNEGNLKSFGKENPKRKNEKKKIIKDL
jgi:hypothetical protein